MNEQANQSEPGSPSNQPASGPFKIDIQFILNRVKDICVDPKGTWLKIKDEKLDVKDFYLNFLLPLVAFSAVCTFIGSSVVGTSIPGLGSYRVPIMYGLTSAIVTIAMSLIGIYIAAFVLQNLAPKFEGKAEIEDTLKLVGYSASPMYVAGVLTLIPILGLLGIIVALYTIYIFFCGVVPLTSVSEGKKFPYVIVSAVLIFLINIVIAVFTSMVTPAPPTPTFGQADFSKQLEQALGQ